MFARKVDRIKDISARDLKKYSRSNIDDLPIENKRKIDLKRNDGSNKSLLRDPGSLKLLTDESNKNLKSRVSLNL
jgi:hypothetical protein